MDNCQYQSIVQTMKLDYYVRVACQLAPPSPPLPPLAPGIQASFGGIVSLLFTGFVVVLAVGVCKRVADVYQQKKMQRGMTAVDPDETELLRLEDVMPQPQGGVLM